MRILLLLSLATLLLFSSFSSTLCASPAAVDDDNEDLSFLEDETSAPDHHHHDFADDANYGDFDDFDDDSEAYKLPEVDEKDVAVLKDKNFSDVVKNNRFVMVEFYAPWCGHCQALAPEYAAAATELKGEDVILAKVDATEENELGQQYDVQGFPTIYFFVDGIHKPYNGQRTKEAIVTWIKKKIGPGIYNLTTLEDAQRILTNETKVVLGFLNSLVGPESEELASASRIEDDVNFYQTVNSDVAKLFHIDPDVKRPALILVKKEEEKLKHFDGKFEKSAIADFVFSNKLPLVTIFTRESAPAVFENSIKKQLLLFATSSDSEKFLPVFQEAAKSFNGKLIFVYVDLDNEDVGKPVSEYFGISGDAPKVLAYTGNDDGRKFLLDGEVTADRIKAFGEDFLDDKLKPFHKSDPIPEKNDGDVKIVVGNNFDEIVLDESKDVLKTMKFFAVVVLALIGATSALPCGGNCGGNGGGLLGGLLGGGGGGSGGLLGGLLGGSGGLVGGLLGGSGGLVGGLLGGSGGLVGGLLGGDLLGGVVGTLTSTLASLDVTGLLSGVIETLTSTVFSLTSNLPIIGGLGGSGNSCGNGSVDFLSDIFAQLEVIVNLIANFTSIVDLDIDAIFSGLTSIVSQLTVAFGEQVISVVADVVAQLQVQIQALIEATIDNAVKVVGQITAQISATFTVVVDLIAQISATASAAIEGATAAASDALNSAIAGLLGVFSVLSTAVETVTVAVSAAVDQVTRIAAQLQAQVQAVLGQLISAVEGVISQVTDVIAQLTAQITTTVSGATTIVSDLTVQLQAVISVGVEVVTGLVSQVSGILSSVTGILSTDVVGQITGSVFASLDVVFSVTAQVSVIISTVTDVVSGLTGLLGGLSSIGGSIGGSVGGSFGGSAGGSSGGPCPCSG